MENRDQVLKQLGFSDELIQAVNDFVPYEYPFINSESSMSVFDPIDVTPADSTNIIIEKTAEPVKFIYSD